MVRSEAIREPLFIRMSFRFGYAMFIGQPHLLNWVEKPWYHTQENVMPIQQHSVDCIAAAIEPQTSGTDNLNTLALVEAAYISAFQARMVDLSSL